MKSRLFCGATDAKQKAIELAKLTSAFPMQGQDQVSSDLRVETYFDALEGFPAWAIHDARMLVVNGLTAFGRPWGPGPIEFADLVKQVLRPLGDDLRDLSAILLAAPLDHEPPADERARVAQGFDGLRASFNKRSAHQVYEDAMAGLKARAPGVDLDKIPSAPERQGTFRKVRAT